MRKAIARRRQQAPPAPLDTPAMPQPVHAMVTAEFDAAGLHAVDIVDAEDDESGSESEDEVLDPSTTVHDGIFADGYDPDAVVAGCGMVHLSEAQARSNTAAQVGGPRFACWFSMHTFFHTEHAHHHVLRYSTARWFRSIVFLPCSLTHDKMEVPAAL